MIRGQLSGLGFLLLPWVLGLQFRFSLQVLLSTESSRRSTNLLYIFTIASCAQKDEHCKLARRGGGEDVFMEVSCKLTYVNGHLVSNIFVFKTITWMGSGGTTFNPDT